MDYRNRIGRGGAYRSGHGLFEEIISLENLLLAWHEFKAGKGNKQDVKAFEFSLEDELFGLHEQLLNKEYIHSAYIAFFVTDPKLRHIHKATVRDRVLHQAIFRVLYPIFDRSFIFDSNSCRINKGTHRGVARLTQFARKLSKNNSKNIFALKCDVRKFFDSIDHKILYDLIKRRIHDVEALGLIQLIIDSFPHGLPLGNVTSQLFSNICLNELDQFAKRTMKEKYYIRYCDDFIILTENRDELGWLIEKIRSFLSESLKLTLHPNKIIIRTYRQGIDFLGYVIRPHARTLRTRTKNRMFRKMQQKSLTSYLGLLQHCNGHKITKIIHSLISV